MRNSVDSWLSFLAELSKRRPFRIQWAQKFNHFDCFFLYWIFSFESQTPSRTWYSPYFYAAYTLPISFSIPTVPALHLIWLRRSSHKMISIFFQCPFHRIAKCSASTLFHAFDIKKKNPTYLICLRFNAFLILLFSSCYSFSITITILSSSFYFLLFLQWYREPLPIKFIQFQNGAHTVQAQVKNLQPDYGT